MIAVNNILIHNEIHKLLFYRFDNYQEICFSLQKNYQFY